jgi:EmrB/QacA subfamily drug resistance transporter
LAIQENKGISNKISYKWLALLTVAIGSFMGGLGSSLVNISFPRLTRIFEIEPSVVLWVNVVYFLVSTSFMPVIGRMGDLFGRKRLYILGFILFTVGLVLCSLSQSILQLILFRIVQGAGGAIIMGLSFAIVTEAFPGEERGKALGIMTAVMLAGPLTGPVLGGFLLDTLNWRSLFYTSVPIGIIGLVMGWTLLKEQKAFDISSELDLWGAATLSGSVACFLLFFNLGGRSGFASLPVLLLASGVVILLALFVLQEIRIAHPVVDLNLFRNWLFTSSNITLGFQSIALAIYIFIMPFYLIDGLSYSAMQTGFVYAVAPLTSVVIAPLSGWLSDKISSRLLCTVGMILMCLSFFLFSRLGAESSVADILPMFVVNGIGMGLFRSPNASQIMGAVPKDRLGTASALMNTIGQIGMSSGMIIAGVIFTSRQAFHAAQLASDNLDPLMLHKLSLVGGYQDTILMAAIACGIGILMLLISAKKPPELPETPDQEVSHCP